MSDLLQTLVPYIPLPLLRTILAAPGRPVEPIVERFPAAVLFADVSGFTSLTEALAQRGTEGPEELTRLLNRYFSRMIALTESEGGEVVKFNGDALTVLFPAKEESLGQVIRRAKQAAEAMQEAMAEFAALQSSVGPVALGMKIGIGAGEVLAMQVGGVADRWEYLIAGDPLQQVAEAERQAGRGEILLSPEAGLLLHPDPLPSRPLVRPDCSEILNPAAVEAGLRCFVPEVVLGWLKEGLRDWLAVLRPMSVLFAGVGGLDYAKENAVDELQNFLCAALKVIYRYQGTLGQLVVDDKGTVLVVFFGAPPYAHEDDPIRAVRCALDLQSLSSAGTPSASPLRLAMGLTTGHVFAGPVGSPTRREYAVVGDTVNLAARLMGLAGKASVPGAGDILCDFDTYRQAWERIAFKSLPSVRVKGKTGLIRAYRPTGLLDSRQRPVVGDQAAIVGRKAELTRLEAALESLQGGVSRILIIEGEAGIGKSRLVAELTRLAQERGLAWLIGAGRSIEQQTPYRAWRDVFAYYFGLGEISDPLERRTRVQELVLEATPEQAQRLPLLNDVLNLDLPDTDLTASLDPGLRQQSLVLLLVGLLRAWARERPLLLVLEDVHWLDSLSWELIVALARAPMAADAPLLLVLATRPLDEHSMGAQHLASLRATGTVETLPLGTLSSEEVVALVTARLGLRQGGLPDPVADLVRQRAEGNPFFAEELVFTLRDQGVIAVEPGFGVEEANPRPYNQCVIRGDLAETGQALPDTVQGLILARIDRLPPERQLTLKVAAVIGRTFGYTPLRYTLQRHSTVTDRGLRQHLDTLSALGLTPLDAPEPELTYIFKHIITREVAYETLLFAQRRQLHRTVAGWYEATFGDDRRAVGSAGTDQRPPSTGHSPLSTYYPLLVYHYHHAGDRERERYYAELAGEQAAAQFANAEAVRYLSRALELTPETDRARRYALLLSREKVYDIQGRREAQRQDLAALEALAQVMDDDLLRAEVALHQADCARRTGDYNGAIAAAQAAVHLAQEGRSRLRTDQESAGRQFDRLQALGYVQWGRALLRQGNYQDACLKLERAVSLSRATQLREAESDGLRSLGIAAYYQGDYVQAKAYYEQALHICRRTGERRGEGGALNNIALVFADQGDYAQARAFYEQARLIFREIGDRWGEAGVFGNLGLVSLSQGDYVQAREYYQEAQRIRRQIGDRRHEGEGLASLGLIFHRLGDDQAARESCLGALDIAQSLGDRSIQGMALTYLGHALAGLGKLGEAVDVYRQALDLRRELGEHNLAMEPLAGLARVSLALGDLSQARAQIEEILDHLETKTLEGTREPLLIYLTCYHVLQANGDPRTQAILSRAHHLLQERAARIRDEETRRSFLENVAAHREIRRLVDLSG